MQPLLYTWLRLASQAIRIFPMRGGKLPRFPPRTGKIRLALEVSSDRVFILLFPSLALLPSRPRAQGNWLHTVPQPELGSKRSQRPRIHRPVGGGSAAIEHSKKKVSAQVCTSLYTAWARLGLLLEMNCHSAGSLWQFISKRSPTRAQAVYKLVH